MNLKSISHSTKVQLNSKRCKRCFNKFLDQVIIVNPTTDMLSMVYSEKRFAAIGQRPYGKPMWPKHAKPIIGNKNVAEKVVHVPNRPRKVGDVVIIAYICSGCFIEKTVERKTSTINT